MLLALWMVLVQQGALLHELSHYTSPDAQTELGHKKHVAAGACALCLSFAQVNSGAASALVPTALRADVAFHWEPASPVHPRAAAVPAQRSRGPPSFC